jgi:hypothetical protein
MTTWWVFVNKLDHLKNCDSAKSKAAAMSADNNEFIKLQKQADSLKMIAGVLSARLAVGFTARIVWTQLVTYEERVNTQGQQITPIEKQISGRAGVAGDGRAFYNFRASRLSV